MTDRYPPGRAGRLWLRSRIASTQRNLDLLDRKRRLLRRELDDLTARRDDARLAWQDACTDARTWALRLTSIGPASDLPGAAAATGPADVTVEWATTIGVRHPVRADTSLPVPSPAVRAASGAALAPAARAHRGALEAAATVAAIERWHQIIRDELEATEIRTRAIERVRLPTLETALRRLEVRLDELEREERVATRWAATRRGDRR